LVDPDVSSLTAAAERTGIAVVAVVVVDIEIDIGFVVDHIVVAVVELVVSFEAVHS